MEAEKSKYMNKKKVSIIVSVYNEEDVLLSFYKEVLKTLVFLDKEYELIFVNDGSMDGSRGILFHMARDNENVKLIHFSKNFGHEAAMLAGIDHASGDYLICMDADLQHPPQEILAMVRKFDEGYDVINMIRTGNPSAGAIKNFTSGLFYDFINSISSYKLIKNVSDFFGISARVADVLRNHYREKTRFLRGYIQNMGFHQVNLEYEAHRRAAGESKYSLRKLLYFSINTIVCFSDLPLRLALYAGMFSGFLGFIVMLYTIVTWFRVGTPNGYATIVVLLCFMFAVLFFILGIMGEYIGILFAEIKDRPIYIVEETVNMKERE